MFDTDILLPDLNATRMFAQDISLLLHKGSVLTLKGDLGVGKTEFARALLQALGATGDIPSPTFTLLQTYEINDLLISHFDLYRLKSADELDELGWDDALADGITLVEWPERAYDRLPENRLELHFTLGANRGRICHVYENKKPIKY